ncbi:MAG: hypothetical protein OQK12_13370 [Motiliproteus sp.]|nr:hypothetical protein [Motiliproteus sp.]MCW9053662.1 hypothetical protein [Motiliproteus sp.]
MLEINDHMRLVKHGSVGQTYWVAQQRSNQESSYKRDIWMPISQLLTPSQAEYWLSDNNVSDELLKRFKKVTCPLQ